MSSEIFIIIPIVIVIVITLITILIWLIFKKRSKKNNKNNKIYIKKDNFFFKDYKPIHFNDFKNHNSGLVLSSGIKKYGQISNKFVIKNLNKNKNKKLEIEKLSVCVSDKKSSIVIAPPGTGKTQAFLIPTIFYNIYCKDKPIMIITDPKPEIQDQLYYHFCKNNYEIINISLKPIKDKYDNYLTDFWNPLQNIIFYHKKLNDIQNQIKIEQQIFLIQKEIEELIDIITFNSNLVKNSDYWHLNQKLVLKFCLIYFLVQIENKCLNYEHFNLKNIIYFLNSTDSENFKNIIKTKNLEKTKLFQLLISYSGWKHESKENIASFITSAINSLSFFNEHYYSLLTSKTTFDLDKLIKSKKHFVIFITLNLSSELTNEKNLTNLYLSLINKKINYYKDNDNDFRKKDVFWFVDEAGNINKINFISQIIAFGRGLNNYAIPIFQSEEQINKIYQNEGFLDSTEYKILFSHSNNTLAKRLSDLEGKYFNKTDNKYENNIDIEQISKINAGFLGLWKLFKKKSDKIFYILPITFFYMLKTIKTKPKYKNKNYILNDYLKIPSINNEEPNPDQYLIDLGINISKINPVKKNVIKQFIDSLLPEFFNFYKNFEIEGWFENPIIKLWYKKYNEFSDKNVINIPILEYFFKSVEQYNSNSIYQNPIFKNIYEETKN